MIAGLLANMTALVLVFARMYGMLALNPLLNRRNVPMMLRAGMVLLLTLLIAPGMPVPSYRSWFDLTGGMLLEVFVGLFCGVVFQIFYYMLFFAGDLMDVQFGLSMAKIFDPGTSIQMSVSGNLLNVLFVLYIFATNSHLLLIRIFTSSFLIVPAGEVQITQQAAAFIFEIFVAAFSLALRLAMPFIAAEFVLEMSMGVLMKLIPQIHVFVINIQFKVLLGILLILAFAGPISSFLDNYMNIMFENIEQALYLLA